MCFGVIQDNKLFPPTKKIAYEPIIVWKLCYQQDVKSLAKPYFEYNPDFIYTKDILTDEVELKLELKKSTGWWGRSIIAENLNWYVILKGYHSYKNRPQQYSMSASTVAKFEIPVGAEYYFDGENEYVSNTIIFRKWEGD